MPRFRELYLESARLDKQPMKSDDFITIRKIAEEARNTIQKYFKDNEDKFGVAVGPDDLAGACAISSFFIQRKLKQKGYESYVQCVNPRVGGAHCFVIIQGNNNRHILDITATQFSKVVGKEYPKIVMRRGGSSKKYDPIHKHDDTLLKRYGDEAVKSDEAWINKNWWHIQSPGFHKELFK